ncbi:MAG: hypothetical protein AB7V77_04545 [Candidatus Woesearchaeota archaeon]
MPLNKANIELQAELPIISVDNVTSEFFSLDLLKKFINSTLNGVDLDEVDWVLVFEKQLKLKNDFLYKTLSSDFKFELYENVNSCGVDSEEYVANLRFQKGLIAKPTGEYKFESISLKGSSYDFKPGFNQYKIFLIEDIDGNSPLMRMDYLRAPFWKFSWKPADLEEQIPSKELSNLHIVKYSDIKKMGY